MLEKMGLLLWATGGSTPFLPSVRFCQERRLYFKGISQGHQYEAGTLSMLVAFGDGQKLCPNSFPKAAKLWPIPRGKNSMDMDSS